LRIAPQNPKTPQLIINYKFQIMPSFGFIKPKAS